MDWGTVANKRICTRYGKFVNTEVYMAYRLVNYQKTVQYTIPGLYIMSIYAIIIVRICVRLQAHVEKNKNFSKEYSFVDTIFTDRSGGK